MLELTDERGKEIYIAHEAIAVIRPVVVKETMPVGQTAIVLISGQTMFVVNPIAEVVAKYRKAA